MNTVIEVRNGGDSHMTARLVSALGFSGLKMHLAGTCGCSTGKLVDPCMEAEKELSRTGTVLSKHCSVDTMEGLLHLGEASGADLIISALPEPATELDRMRLAKLVHHAGRSVLVNRSEPSLQPVLELTLAVRHSPYAHRCVRSLLRMQPKGLKRVNLVSSFEPRSVREPGEQPAIKDGRLSERTLLELNSSLAEMIQSYGYTCESRVVVAPFEDAIRTMGRRLPSDIIAVASHEKCLVDWNEPVFRAMVDLGKPMLFLKP